MEPSHPIERRFSNFKRFAQTLGRARSTDELLASLASWVYQLIDCDRASLTVPEVTEGPPKALIVHAMKGNSVLPAAARVPIEGTAVGQSFREGQRIYIPDERLPPFGDAQGFAKAGLLSSAIAPMVAGGRVLGTLNIAHRNVDAFEESDLELLDSIASVMAVHLSVHDRLDLTLSRLDRVEEMASALSKIVDFASVLFNLEHEEEVYSAVAQQLPEVLPGARWSIATRSEEPKGLQLRTRIGQPLCLPSDRLPLEGSVVGRAFTTRALIVVDDFATTDWLEAKPMLQRGLHSAVTAPFFVGETPEGTINVARVDERAFDDGDRLLLQQCAVTVSQALTAISTRRTLRRAREDAEQASRAKGGFVASVTHELRTPLNGVIGMTHVLEGTPLSGEQREAVQTIQSSGTLLLRLISDVLDFSKIEAGGLELNPQPFELSALLEESLTTVRCLALEKGLKLELEVAQDTPGSWVGDDLRLRQVLTNLLSNAIKFTSEGSVTVRASAAQSTGLEIEVADTGVGITKEASQHIFEPFRQADSSTTRHYGGTGLGLALCKHICEKMGGDISLRSSSPQGSVFAVRLPLPAMTAQHASKRVEARAEIDAQLASRFPASILVVDDSPVNLLVAHRLLKRMGYRADQASSGRQALQMVGEKRYDLVLLDLQMPEMDGLETLEHLRSLQVPTPKVAILTADSQVSTRLQCESAGVQSFLTKPIRIPELTALLQAAPDSTSALTGN